jgi:hypothetical protein
MFQFFPKRRGNKESVPVTRCRAKEVWKKKEGGGGRGQSRRKKMAEQEHRGSSNNKEGRDEVSTFTGKIKKRKEKMVITYRDVFDK